MDQLKDKYLAGLQPRATSPTALRAEACIPDHAPLEFLTSRDRQLIIHPP